MRKKNYEIIWNHFLSALGINFLSAIINFYFIESGAWSIFLSVYFTIFSFYGKAFKSFAFYWLYGFLLTS